MAKHTHAMTRSPQERAGSASFGRKSGSDLQACVEPSPASSVHTMTLTLHSRLLGRLLISGRLAGKSVETATCVFRLSRCKVCAGDVAFATLVTSVYVMLHVTGYNLWAARCLNVHLQE